VTVCVRVTVVLAGVGDSDCMTVCAGAAVVLAGVIVGDCEGRDVVDVYVVTGDGALHPDTKSRKITKMAKIGRTFMNGYSGSHHL
jgi:hypothetical protein